MLALWFKCGGHFAFHDKPSEIHIIICFPLNHLQNKLYFSIITNWLFIFIDIILPALTKTEQIFPGLSY